MWAGLRLSVFSRSLALDQGRHSSATLLQRGLFFRGCYGAICFSEGRPLHPQYSNTPLRLFSAPAVRLKTSSESMRLCSTRVSPKYLDLLTPPLQSAGSWTPAVI